MKYLGIPISDTKLGMGALAKVAEKISRRTPPWKGKNMSSRGGSFFQIAACLSCMATPWAFIFCLLEPTKRWIA
jgi:hypothetical protein